jgi:hypothetical protein
MEMPDIFLAAQQGPAVDCRFIWRRWVCGDSDTTPSINVTHPRKIRTRIRWNNQTVVYWFLIKKTKLLIRNICITEGTGNEKYAEGVMEGANRRFIWKMQMESHTDSVKRKVFSKMYKKGV